MRSCFTRTRAQSSRLRKPANRSIDFDPSASLRTASAHDISATARVCCMSIEINDSSDDDDLATLKPYPSVLINCGLLGCFVSNEDFLQTHMDETNENVRVTDRRRATRSRQLHIRSNTTHNAVNACRHRTGRSRCYSYIGDILWEDKDEYKSSHEIQKAMILTCCR
jgi:hypothetical protein